MSHLTWVWRTELGSSARTVSILNYKAISPAQYTTLSLISTHEQLSHLLHCNLNFISISY